MAVTHSLTDWYRADRAVKQEETDLKKKFLIADHQETYRGSEASSEPETKAVATALLAIKDKVSEFILFEFSTFGCLHV